MDPKQEGGGGDADANDAKNDNTNGNAQQQQQQQQHPMYPFGMMMPPGGMMGASLEDTIAMMEDTVAMSMGGGGHPGGGFPPGFGGFGPPPPGMMISDGGPPSGMMPPWMISNGGPPVPALMGSSKAVQKKGKQSKKEGQQSLISRTAKRRRNNDGGKDATTVPEVHIELMTDSWKKNVLDKFPRCKAAEGIRDTSYFATTSKGRNIVAGGGSGGRYSSRAGARSSSRATAAVGSTSNIRCLRKLLSELNRMEYEDSDQLPGGIAPIWLRYDDERPQYMRAMITGPPRDTPYSNGLFAFDIYVPNSYPRCSPRVQLLTTGGGTVGFGPNLYRNGTVCLSLLNTWSGPKWDPNTSSILQILVSIQGLILGVEHPYYLEPGYGGWEGSNGTNAASTGQAPIMTGSGPLAVPVMNPKKGSGAAKSGAGTGAQNYVPSNVRNYENNIRMATMKFAIGEYCIDMNRARSSGAMTPRPNYLSAFKDIMGAHFWYRKECIKADAKKWVNMVQSQSQKRKMQTAREGLELALGQLEEPCAVTMESSTLVPNGKATTAVPSSASSTIEDKDTVDARKKSAAVVADVSSISPETSAKRREMEAAAAKGDYISAGRIQSQMELSTKVQDLIVSRAKEMDDAAAKKDYVEAGRLQLIVKHLECNCKRLQDLESRMFEYASRQDFVKAGRFQEQYRVLMESAEVDSASTLAGTSGATAKAPSIGPGGPGGHIASAYPHVSKMLSNVMGAGGGGYDYDSYDDYDFPEDEYGDY